MATANITKRFVDGIKPSGLRQDYFDEDLKGFYLRVSGDGESKTYGVMYRNKVGTKIRLKIATHGVMTPDQARKEAVQLLAAVAKGVDPASQTKAYREAWTVSDLAKFYRESILPAKRPQTIAAYSRQIDRFIVPKLGKIKLTEVTTPEVVKFHRAISPRGNTQANRVVRCLSSMFAEAIREGHVVSNPCSRVKLHLENKCERFMTEEELGGLLIACDEHPNQQVANLVRLLVFTGARKTETMTSRWDMFDLERGIWTKPSHHTKQKKIHTVPLSKEALALLHDMRAAADETDADNPWLFPGLDPEKPLSEVKTPWGQIVGAAKLEGVTLHVIRHTFASHIVSSSGSLPKTGKLLGHTNPATTHRYAHLAVDSLKETTGAIDRAAAAGKVKALSKRKADAAKVVNIGTVRKKA